MGTREQEEHPKAPATAEDRVVQLEIDNADLKRRVARLEMGFLAAAAIFESAADALTD